MRRARSVWIALVVVVAFSLAAGTPGLAQSVARRGIDAPPKASSIRSAADAASVLRQLYFLSDYFDAAALGDSLYRRFGRDTRVLAWYVAALTRTQEWARADSLTRTIDSTSRDASALVARSFVLSSYVGPTRTRSVARGLAFARRAAALAPNDPAVAWRVADAMRGVPNMDTAIVAFADAVGPRLGNPVDLQLARALSLYYLASRPPVDTGRRSAALRAFAAVRASDTSSYAAIYQSGSTLAGERGHEAEGLALLQLAVARSPRATLPRTSYWRALEGRADMAKDERHALVVADRQRWMSYVDSATWAMGAVASYLARDTTVRQEVAQLEARILARAPRSPQAEDVLYARATRWGDSLYRARDTTVAGPRPDSVVMRRSYRAALEAFLDRPWHTSSMNMSQAAMSLFLDVRDDSAYPGARLTRVVKTMVDGAIPMNFSISHGMAARSLAEHKVAFPYAEQLARDGEKIVPEVIATYPEGIFSSVGEKADAFDGMRAGMQDALAWVYYNEGRYADADRELNAALDLTKKDATLYYHLGKLRHAQGRDDEAELAYAQGMSVRYRGDNPNRTELSTLYRAHHGSMAGWTEYLAALEEKERTTRRARILATRSPEPKLGGGFRMADLTGDTISTESLRGRSAVINFWGTWCGPCVAEMPELQQFYDKYRRDSSVAILTISNDKDLGDLKDWMAKRKLTIPTLFDNGFVATAGIRAWPTTWFVGPDGRVQFTAIGNSGALVEEWSWRLDAVRGAAIVP